MFRILKWTFAIDPLCRKGSVCGKLKLSYPTAWITFVSTVIAWNNAVLEGHAAHVLITLDPT